MAFELPIYVMAGDQPVSFEATPEGGADLKGWDFKKGKMTREAGDWDAIEGLQTGLPVKGNSDFSEGDVRRVTKQEFDAAVAALERGETAT